MNDRYRTNLPFLQALFMGVFGGLVGAATVGVLLGFAGAVAYHLFRMLTGV